MSHLEAYQIPREQVDVEALARQYAYYIQVADEDTEFLNTDPTRREQIFAELYSMDGVKPDIFPESFVPFGEDPDVHLTAANECIAQLTPPRTFEDRAKRLHYVIPALMVFNHYKIHYGLSHCRDLSDKVEERKDELMAEWDAQFPHGIKSQPPSTPPQRGLLPTPPATRHSGAGVPKRVSNGDVQQFLSTPLTLLGKKFMHAAPHGQNQEDCGAWQVESYNARMGENGVEQEYHVLLEAFGGDSLPMNEEEVRYLLASSTLAS